MRPETQIDQRSRSEFSARVQFPVGLELPHGSHGIRVPDTGRFGFQISFRRKRLLNFFVPIGCGRGLPRDGRSTRCGPFRCGRAFLRYRLLRRDCFLRRCRGLLRGARRDRRSQNKHRQAEPGEFHHRKRKGANCSPPLFHCTRFLVSVLLTGCLPERGRPDRRRSSPRLRARRVPAA